METKQAVEVVHQAVQIALGSGAFKNTKDVTVIHQALEQLAKGLKVDEAEIVQPTMEKR